MSGDNIYDSETPASVPEYMLPAQNEVEMAISAGAHCFLSAIPLYNLAVRKQRSGLQDQKSECNLCCRPGGISCRSLKMTWPNSSALEIILSCDCHVLAFLSCAEQDFRLLYHYCSLDSGSPFCS